MTYYDVKILCANGTCEIIKNCKDIMCRDDYIIFYEKVGIPNKYRRHYIDMNSSIISIVITTSESEVY